MASSECVTPAADAVFCSEIASFVIYSLDYTRGVFEPSNVTGGGGGESALSEPDRNRMKHGEGFSTAEVKFGVANTFNVGCCHMGTAIKHRVPDRVKASFVIFDIRAF